MNFKLIINILKYIFLLLVSLGRLSFLSKLNNHILYKGKCKLKVRFSTYSADNNLCIEKKVKGSLKIKISGNNNTVRVGEKCVFDNLKIRIVGDNNKIIFGEGTSFGRNGSINLTELVPNESRGRSIIIGDNCMVSYDVDIRNSDGHPIYSLDNEKIIINQNDNIDIANNVWIGARAMILKGSNVNENSVIGACSLVRGTVESNSIYAGIPAKKIKSNIFWKKYHA